MKKRTGFLLLLVALCALLSYEVQQAASEGKQAAKDEDVTASAIAAAPAAAIPAPVLSAPEKIGDSEMSEEAQAEAIKAIEARLEAAQGKSPVGSGQLAAPEAELTEEEIAAEVAETEASERALQEALSKTEAGFQLTPEQKELVDGYMYGRDDLRDRNPGDPLDNVGGPDAANYFFVDNQGGDSATYDWIELRGDVEATWLLGSEFTSLDDGTTDVRHPIGFNFNFYGVACDSFKVCTNGFINFSGTSSSRFNSCLPDADLAAPAVCVFNDDLHLARFGNTPGDYVVGYKNFGTYAVIEFDSIGFFSSSCDDNSVLKMEIVLHDDGRIKLQYNTVFVEDACDSNFTIGIQSNGTAGSPALNYSCLATDIQPINGLAIWFYQHFFDHDFATTSITSPSGYYDPNTVVAVTARFTNTGLTSESSPVKYSFNGGATVEEATPVLNQNEFDDHTFAASITTPASPGAYTLTAWTDLTTDEARGNDTLRTTIQVGGDDCNGAIPLTGLGPDSAQFNNCAMTDDTPGQPCGVSGKDVVFSIEVPNGYQLEVWLGTNSIVARHTLRWGGTCPGDNFIDCLTSETRRQRFVNNTGLNDVAYYTVGMTTSGGTCGNFVVNWALTECSALTIPVLENFDAVSTPILPACWGTVQALPLTAVTSPTWESYSSLPYSAPNSASILGATTGNDDWLFTPGIALTGGQGYVLDFWWRGASTTVPESLEVMAGIANTSGDMAETVFALDTIKSNVYQQFFGSFTPGADGIYYLGFHNTTKRSAGRTRIDDVQLYEVGGCVAPDVTVNAVVGQDSATLVATTVGGAGGPPEFQWFTGDGCVPGNEIVGAMTDTYVTHVSGVFSCKAWIIDPDNCADCDSAEATVIDCSIPVALPFAEGFEATSGTALPVCWSFQNYDGDARMWTTSTTNPHTGLRTAYIQYSASGVIPDDWMFTPPFSLTAGTDYFLDFWWRQYLTSSTYYDSLEVLLTSAPNNASTVAVLVPIFRANTTTYQEDGSIFTPPADGDYYIAFRYTGGDNDGGIRVDDVSLSVAGDCVAPTVSVADSSGIGTVTMFCSATGGSGGPLAYQWYTGQACTPGNEIAGQTSSTYATTLSGDYACKSWRYDPDNCAACDWGTATVNPAPPGYDCTNPLVLTTANEDSALYNNCDMGDNNPGQSCGNSRNDMVFMMEVPDGYTASIYQYYNNFDSRHSLRWGGACPGDNLVGCTDDPDYTQYLWTNCTGSTQNVYFVVGYYSTSNLCGDFRLRWSLTGPCEEITCTPTVTESGANGGCGVDSLFNTIVCGDVVSGSVFATTSLRDVDVFELSLADSANLIITALAEFDAQLQVRYDTDGLCPDIFVGNINDFGACGTESQTIYSVPPGLIHISIVSPFVETCGDRDYCLTVQCAPPAPVSYVQDFEADNGGAVATPETGGWEWGVPTAPDGPSAAHSGTNVWGTVLAGDYPSNACWTLDFDLGLSVASPDAVVECWIWYDTESNYDGVQFHASVDGGSNWELVTPSGGYPQDDFTVNACLGTTTDYWGGNSGGWIPAIIPIGSYQGQAPIFRFWFGSDPSVTYPGFFLDDVTIRGLQSCEPDTVDNLTVYRDALLSNDVHLRWSGDPAMEGTYTVYWNNTMDVFPGSWTVLAGGLAPAADMEYVDVGVVTAAAKRYYLIVSECSAVVAASKPVPIAPGAQK